MISDFMRSEMTVRYEIRQQIGSVRNNWIVQINKDSASEKCERVAKKEYEDLVRDYPDYYFELVKITVEEECIAFTPKFD